MGQSAVPAGLRTLCVLSQELRGRDEGFGRRYRPEESRQSRFSSIEEIAKTGQRLDLLDRARVSRSGFKGSASGTGEPPENAAMTNAASTQSAPTGTR